MKTGIHPKYSAVTVKCACGNEFVTRSTKNELSVVLCNECHPFYTGKQKFVDTAGRIDKFKQRYGSVEASDIEEMLKAAKKTKSKKQIQAAAIQAERKDRGDRRIEKKKAKSQPSSDASPATPVVE